ncbi:hypothetical protein LXL04_023545 [Taraxacum kok-saghyz]
MHAIGQRHSRIAAITDFKLASISPRFSGLTAPICGYRPLTTAPSRFLPTSAVYSCGTPTWVLAVNATMDAADLVAKLPAYQHTEQKKADKKHLSRTFGCGSAIIEGDNFIAENVTFENNAHEVSHQAVAVRISAKRCAFYNSRFLGFQGSNIIRILILPYSFSNNIEGANEELKPLEGESDAVDAYMVVMNKENDGYRRLYGRCVTNRLKRTMTKRFKRTIRSYADRY